MCAVAGAVVVAVAVAVAVVVVVVVVVGGWGSGGSTCCWVWSGPPFHCSNGGLMQGCIGGG